LDILLKNRENKMQKIVYGNVVDLFNQKIFPASIEIENGYIKKISKIDRVLHNYVLCGFIDAHIHIESSMMPPSEFARLALGHGTIGAVTDPHEIANVLGVDGVKFMIESGKKVPFYFSTGLPSCVPATTFETAGATIGIKESKELMELDEITHLSEVMNIPAVLNYNSEMMQKMALAKEHNRPIDGHAPLLRGKDLSHYIASGITTDHEAVTYDEAKEKIGKGMKIQIREGSSAKNFEALYPLIDEFPDSCMLCSDDLHPDDLVQGHINLLVKRASQKGVNFWKLLRCASINPNKHYGLSSGLLRVGDSADFIEVDNLQDFNVLKTYIKGEVVASHQKPLIPFQKEQALNNFKADLIPINSLKIKTKSHHIRVIKAMDGELITQEILEKPTLKNGYVVSDTSQDILKIVVLNRYETKSKLSIDFIEGFGIKKGAMASTIAHDSHNIIAVGVDDSDIAKAINIVIQHQGGISAVCEGENEILPLEIAGLMSQQEGTLIAKSYKKLDMFVKRTMGSTLNAPYMTLSFMALLVIPEIKISDKGLFSAKNFRFVEFDK